MRLVLFGKRLVLRLGSCELESPPHNWLYDERKEDPGRLAVGLEIPLGEAESGGEAS